MRVRVCMVRASVPIYVLIYISMRARSRRSDVGSPEGTHTMCSTHCVHNKHREADRPCAQPCAYHTNDTVGGNKEPIAIWPALMAALTVGRVQECAAATCG